jgi:hypothetical protein
MYYEAAEMAICFGIAIIVPGGHKLYAAAQQVDRNSHNSWGYECCTAVIYGHFFCCRGFQLDRPCNPESRQ